MFSGFIAQKLYEVNVIGKEEVELYQYCLNAFIEIMGFIIIVILGDILFFLKYELRHWQIHQQSSLHIFRKSVGYRLSISHTPSEIVPEKSLLLSESNYR